MPFWRAASLDELQRRDLSDASPAVRTRLNAAMAAHAQGRGTREVWTIYPGGVGTMATPTLLTTGDPDRVNTIARIFWPGVPAFGQLAV